MTAYRAPLQDMRFVINELAGLKTLAALPGYEEVTPELAEAVLDEAARLASEVLAPLNKPGDEAGRVLDQGRRRRGRRLWRSIPTFRRQRLERPRRRPRIWRTRAAGAGGRRGRGNVELGQHVFRALPSAYRRGDGGDQGACFRRAEDALSAKARQRRVVGHDESDRTAGRFRLGGGPDQGPTRRRPLPDLWPGDLHHLGRSRH